MHRACFLVVVGLFAAAVVLKGAGAGAAEPISPSATGENASNAPPQRGAAYSFTLYPLPADAKLTNETPVTTEMGLPSFIESTGEWRQPSGALVRLYRGRDGKYYQQSPRSGAASGRTTSSRPSQGSMPAAPPLKLEAPDATIELPGPVDNVVVGGHGRYLLLAMPSLQQVGVFDIREAKAPRYVAADSNQFFVAGGATQFVVADAKNHTLKAWRYDQLDQPQATARIDMTGRRKLQDAVLGIDSEGPLGLMFRYETYSRHQPYIELFDLATMARVETTLDWQYRGSSFSPIDGTPFSLSANSDGSQFLRTSGQHVSPIRVVGGVMTVEDEPLSGIGASTSDPYLISFDASALFRRSTYIMLDGQKVEFDPSHGRLSPAYPSHFWTTATAVSQVGRRGLKVGFYAGQQTAPFATLQLDVPAPSSAVGPHVNLHPAKRVYFNANEKTLIVLPDAAPRVVVKRFDWQMALAQSAEPMLEVTSRSPRMYRPGRKFEYAIQSISKHGAVVYLLEAGPAGLTVSADGLVEWTPPTDVSARQVALVRLRDQAGNEQYHAIRLVRDVAASASAAEVAPRPATAKTEVAVQQRAGPAAQAQVAVQKPAKPAADQPRDRVEIRLPTVPDDLVVGAGGRYLLAPMASRREMAVIDVEQRKLIKTIPLDSDVIRVAAGATRFVIYSSAGTLSRWNFDRFECEQTVPFDIVASALCMGSDSEGPLLVCRQLSHPRNTAEPIFYDLDSLRPANLKAWSATTGNEQTTISHVVAAAADGQTFTTTILGESGAGNGSLVVRGDQALHFYSHVRGGPMAPSPNGSVIHTLEGIHRTASDVSPASFVQERSPQPRLSLPAATGNYYLSWPSTPNDNASNEVALHVTGQTAPVLTIPGLQPPPNRPVADHRADPFFSRRLLYVPQANAVVRLGPGDDSLLIDRFAIEDALAKAEQDYLYVASAPPLAVPPGARFEYQLDVKSRQGGVRFKLGSGPEGAELSPTGLLTWTIDRRMSGSHLFVIEITDNSSTEVAHTFNLALDNRLTGTQFGEMVDTGRPHTTIKLPGTIEKLCVGGNGRYLLGFIKSKKQVAVIDVRRSQLLKLIPVDDSTVAVAAGVDKFVVAEQTKGILSRYSLPSCERELSTAAPAVPLADVAMGCNSAGPVLCLAPHPTPHSQHTAELFVLDLDTLKRTNIASPDATSLSILRRLRVSADGQTFLGGSSIFQIDRDRGRLTTSGSASSREGDFLSADGTFVFSRESMHRIDGGVRHSGAANLGYSVPAAVGPLYIRSTVPERPNVPIRLTLHVQGEMQPIATLDEIKTPGLSERAFHFRYPEFMRSFFLLPTAEAIVTLPPTMDALIVHRFNLDEELNNRNDDYLAVLSTPPMVVHPNGRIHYPMDVRSKQGGLKFRLDAGPPGMTISPTGLISWKAQGPNLQTQVVVVAVGDNSGKEILHTFKFNISPNTSPKPATGSQYPQIIPADAPATEPVVAAPVVAAPAKPDVAARPRPKEIVQLPDGIGEICVGGGGRYLLVNQHTARQIAVVDVAERKIARFVPVDDTRFQLAAGQTKLVVALMNKHMLARYDLATGQHEQTLDFEDRIDQPVLGGASEGPLLLNVFKGVRRFKEWTPTFLDLDTLQPLQLSKNQPGPLRLPKRVYASADGRMFCGWDPGSSGLHAVTIDGSMANYFRNSDNVGMVLPSADGRVLYTGWGMYNARAEPWTGFADRKRELDALLPAATGPFYLHMTLSSGPRRRPKGGQEQLSLHLQGETTPLVELHDVVLPETPEDVHPAGVPSLELNNRLFLLPAADALVTVAESKDHLIIQRFKLEEELKRSGQHHLFAASFPPATLKPGEDLEYQIKGISTHGDIQYRLESGPQGMTVSPTGLVKWTAEADDQSATAVVISMTDSSGQTRPHTFKLLVESDKPPEPAPNNRNGPRAPGLDRNQIRPPAPPVRVDTE